jgi:hypothetical protein
MFVSLQFKLELEGANGRNPEQGETKKVSQSAWRVLKVALLFPVLGKVLLVG